MRTVLKNGVFEEVCSICGLMAHCYQSGGDHSRCPEALNRKCKILETKKWRAAQTGGEAKNNEH